MLIVQLLKMKTVNTNNLKTILADMRILLILLNTSLLLSSCTPTVEKTDQEEQSSNSNSSYSIPYTESSLELTSEQQSAFDALNTLQVSTDEKNKLYSTFAGIPQPCYPPDTSFTISRSELLTAMKHFVSKNCTYLSFEERDKLATTGVLAQEEYIVLHCPDNSSNVNYENGLPMTGTWVIPSVLGRRDIILDW